MNTRERAMKWWNDMHEEEKVAEIAKIEGILFYKSITGRRPDTLTGREIEQLYYSYLNRWEDKKTM